MPSQVAAISAAPKPRRAPLGVLVVDFDETLFQVPLSWVDVFCDLMEALAGQGSSSDVQGLRAHLLEVRGLPLTAMVSLAQQRLPELAPHDPREVRKAFDDAWRRAADSLHTMEHVTPGMPELIETVSGFGVPVYVLTGGDVAHKRGIIAGLPLSRSISGANVVGDGDPRLGSARSKVEGLRAIAAETGAGHKDAAGTWGAFVADGVEDFRVAKECGFLSIGLGPHAGAADMSVSATGVEWRWLVAEVFNLEG